MEQLSLKTAWRHLYNGKGFSLINIGGLAIGLCAALLLLLYTASEWQFDTQYADAKNIYVVKKNLMENGNRIVGTGDETPQPLAKAMSTELPGIKAVAVITWPTKTLLLNGERSIKVMNRLAEPDILKVLSYNFISGDASSAFAKPNSIILTRSTAQQLFGDTDALNKTVNYMNNAILTVTGVIEDMPENMSYRFESLVSLNENVGIFPMPPIWNNYSFYTILRLNDGVNADHFNDAFKNFIRKHDQEARATTFIYPLLKTHLYNEFENGKPSGGRIQQVWIFIGLAIGIVLIACINFMNLATAQAGKRAKEVGVRKTMGASRSSLIYQFLFESTVMVFISFALALILTEACLPVFNNLLQTKLSMLLLGSWNWLFIGLGILFTGLLSGSYPAFYLSAFDPARTLKGTMRGNPASMNLRKILVVVQFSCAVFLIIGTVVVYKQLQFIKNRPMGFDSSLLVEMPMEGQLFKKYELLKDRLLASNAVVSLCKTSGSIATQNSSTNGLEWQEMSEADKSISFNQIITTDDFTKTMGVKMVSGRDFSKAVASDSAAILLNKTAVKTMNLRNPIGKQIQFAGIKRTVVGVFEDVTWADPSKKEMPMIVAWVSFIPNLITMRLNPARNPTEALATIHQITKELNPLFPVELQFVDALYQQKFERERKLSILSNLFGGLAIFISCLGLFGLSAYSAELRTKEIGIRKVLGASNAHIVTLLSWSFVKMVLIAIFIAVPLTWLFMNQWLMKFDYHTEISWWIVTFSATSIVLIAFLTVSYQAISAARANPVKAIKHE